MCDLSAAITEFLVAFKIACNTTKVLSRQQRYSAGGIGTFVVHTWYISLQYNEHVPTMEAENSITLTTYDSVNVLIALTWNSEND